MNDPRINSAPLISYNDNGDPSYTRRFSTPHIHQRFQRLDPMRRNSMDSRANLIKDTSMQPQDQHHRRLSDPTLYSFTSPPYGLERRPSVIKASLIGASSPYSSERTPIERTLSEISLDLYCELEERESLVNIGDEENTKITYPIINFAKKMLHLLKKIARMPYIAGVYIYTVFASVVSGLLKYLK